MSNGNRRNPPPPRDEEVDLFGDPPAPPDGGGNDGGGNGDGQPPPGGDGQPPWLVDPENQGMLRGCLLLFGALCFALVGLAMAVPAIAAAIAIPLVALGLFIAALFAAGKWLGGDVDQSSINTSSIVSLGETGRWFRKLKPDQVALNWNQWVGSLESRTGFTRNGLLRLGNILVHFPILGLLAEYALIDVSRKWIQNVPQLTINPSPDEVAHLGVRVAVMPRRPIRFRFRPLENQGGPVLDDQGGPVLVFDDIEATGLPEVQDLVNLCHRLDGDPMDLVRGMLPAACQEAAAQVGADLEALRGGELHRISQLATRALMGRLESYGLMAVVIAESITDASTQVAGEAERVIRRTGANPTAAVVMTGLQNMLMEWLGKRGA